MVVVSAPFGVTTPRANGHQLKNRNGCGAQTMGCLNFINIQTTAVTTGATSFKGVNRICMKGLSL